MGGGVSVEVLLGTWGFIVSVLSLVVSSTRLFKYLVMLEKMNILLLVICLLMSSEESRMFFLVLLSIFVLEIALMLVLVARSCMGLMEVGDVMGV